MKVKGFGGESKLIGASQLEGHLEQGLRSFSAGSVGEEKQGWGSGGEEEPEDASRVGVWEKLLLEVWHTCRFSRGDPRSVAAVLLAAQESHFLSLPNLQPRGKGFWNLWLLNNRKGEVGKLSDRMLGAVGLEKTWVKEGMEKIKPGQ